MIPFPFNENRFSFLVANHLLDGQLCTNSRSDRSLLSCSERDTMFNKQDRRCTAVQLMLSTDLSYVNRTIASTLKMQIQMIQRVQGSENKVSRDGYGLWCGFKWGPHHATSHLWSQLESQHQSVPRVWWSLGVIRWPVADPGCGIRTRRRPTSPKRPRLGFRRSATTL